MSELFAANQPLRSVVAPSERHAALPSRSLPHPGWLQRPGADSEGGQTSDSLDAAPTHVITFADTPVPPPNAQTMLDAKSYVASAARAGDVAMLQRHLAQAPRDVVNVKLDSRHTTLLLLAARHAPANHPLHPGCDGNQAIRYLLTLGANPNAADVRNSTPLHAVAQRGTAFFPAFCGLLDAGANPNHMHRDGTTVMHAALSLYRKNPIPMLHALLRAGVDVNQTSHRGQTPLFITARSCSDPADAIALLLRAGAKPDAPSRYSVPTKTSQQDAVAEEPKVISFGTPLIALAHYCPAPLPAMRLLIDAGADARAARRDWANVSLLDDSVRSMEDIEALFRELLAQKSKRDSPATPEAPSPVARTQLEQPEGLELHTVWSAAASGNEAVVRYYLRSRPELFGHISDKRDKGPATFVLAHAVIGRQLAMVKLLLQETPHTRTQLDAPGPGFDIDARDNQGMTALLYGVQYDSQRAVHALLQAGADPTLHGPLSKRKFLRKAKRYENALMYAIGLHRVSCARSILDWYDKNPQQRINLEKVSQAIEATGNKMMAECFSSFQRKRTLKRASSNQDEYLNGQQ